MEDKLRFAIWKRDKYTCQRCNTKMFSVENPREAAIEDLKQISEVDIFKWLRKCWFCNKFTPIVSYFLEIGCSLYSIGDIEKIDRILMEKYPFVKKTYSKTAGQKTIANVCVFCNKLQGNWYVNEDLQKKTCEDFKFSKMLDQKINISLFLEELPNSEELWEIATRFFDLGEIHHKDKNPKNNIPENLILLCKKCHKETHKKDQ